MKVHYAYFLVHSFAVASYFCLFDLNCCAISGTKGSSGFGSHNNELNDNNILEIVNAGLH